MAVTIELTYEMTKAFGEQRFDVEVVPTVADAVKVAEQRLGEKGIQFDELARVAAVAVNGVLVNHRKGMKTKLRDGDTVTFVKAAAGG
ncbi:MAG: MoaD/ThiS family protein [Deltaproteobacteria bacterium]|nr:MoaD/ThiS family protein [Deltaproteobacteria bacterium]MBW2444879.1 MoaD/ThiS family protein [Deltaproteobacteria bacterium]